MASKKKYPIRKPAQTMKSNVEVNLNGANQEYNPPEGLMEKLKSPKFEGEVKKPMESKGPLKMEGVPDDERIIQGKSGKEYSVGQVKGAISTQQNADADAMKDKKMNIDEMVNRSYKRTKLQKKYPILKKK